jgi:hypothetical protein
LFFSFHKLVVLKHRLYIEGHVATHLASTHIQKIWRGGKTRLKAELAMIKHSLNGKMGGHLKEPRNDDCEDWIGDVGNKVVKREVN